MTRRILYSFPVLIGITLLTFVIFNVMGGDPAFQLAGEHATQENIESIRHELGLDKPLWAQYLDFLKQTITWDWGESWQTKENINSMFLKGLGPSLWLTIPAFFISFLLSIGLALFSAASQGRWKKWDQFIFVGCLAMMSVSFLVYIIGFQYIFAFKLGWFEINGWDSSWSGRWSYLYLPWIIAITVTFGPKTLIFRTAFLEETHQDYVRTAQAKGLSHIVLFSRHILRNALIPIITIAALNIPTLIMGSLLLESFFGIPGVGGLLFQALQNSDFPVVKALTVIGSVFYLIINLICDLLYHWIDPRVVLK